ncbi:MAG: hypothetical protein WCG27_08705 [Pseudomonadota bacterium]
MKWILLVVVLCFYATITWAQEGPEAAATGEGKVIYKYQKFQKFDFEDMVIEGESGSPGDLSITTRFQKQFQNKLPYRKNFNPEIRKAVERIR